MIQAERGKARHLVSVAPMLDCIKKPVIARLVATWRNFWRSYPTPSTNADGDNTSPTHSSSITASICMVQADGNLRPMRP